MHVIRLCLVQPNGLSEAFALAEGTSELNDFHDHTTCYDRASDLGLLSRDTTRDLRHLYDTNRTDSYYGGRRPTQRQAEAMQQLAKSETGIALARDLPDSLPVLLLTTTELKSIAAEALEAGVTDFVHKDNIVGEMNRPSASPW